MKVAFVVDASVEKYQVVEENDMFIVPFQVYDSKGHIHKEFDKEVIEGFQSKQNVNGLCLEPTPGMYRDVYINIMKQGFDYIVVVPQSKKISRSYTFASYASRLGFDNIMVIDVDEYEISALDVLNYVIEEHVNSEVGNVVLDVDSFIDLARSILLSLSMKLKKQTF